MPKKMALVLLSIILAGVLWANNSPLSASDMTFTYHGKVHGAMPNSPGLNLVPMDAADYVFLISCRFDTGGVDIGFMVDSTGSMSGTLASVTATIGFFADSLEAAGFDYRLGACPFGDSTSGMWDFNTTTPGYQMTNNITAFHTKLAGCSAGGGGDSPEEYLDATAALMRNYDWRVLAMKILIGFTDATFCEEGDPCYDCHSNEMGPDIITELLAGGFIIFNVTNSYLYADPCVDPTPSYHLNWYQHSADTTGGQWYPMGTSWAIIFNSVVTFIRDYQSITVAVINNNPDTIYNVWGEFVAGPCFDVIEEPPSMAFIAPGATAIFTWRLDTFDLSCPLDTTSEYCFTTIFHAVDEHGVPVPDFVSGGCVFFGEDCACEGTHASKDYPPDNIITTCPDQCVMYSMFSECPINMESFIFKVNRGAGWAMYPWGGEGMIMDGDSGFIWCPSESSLFFENGDTVRHELFIMDDIAGLPLHEIASGNFIVDLEPPVFGAPYPADGALIGGPPTTVHIPVSDEIAGVNTSGYWMSIGGVRLPTGYSYLTFDGTNISLSVVDTVSALFPPGETTFVCVGAEDDPDMCEPNESEFCWSFIIDYLDFDLPEMTASPGEGVNIPIIAINPQRFTLRNFTIAVRYDPNILNITGATRTGSALPGTWTVSADVVGGVVTVRGNGTGALAEMDTLVMITGNVRDDAPGAGFTLLTYESINLDSGYVGYRILGNGWVLVNWNPEIWTTDLTFNSDTRPNNTILTFGIIPGASDLYDAGTDWQSPPTPPIRTEAFFPIIDPHYPYITRLDRDIRAPLPIPVTWHIATVGEPGVLSWSVISLPEGILTLNGMYEMHHYDTYEYAANETLTIVYDRPAPTMCEANLVVGWNLIGFPCVPTVPVVPNVFPDVFYEIYGYDTDAHSYYSTNSAEVGRGYWAFSSVAGTYPIGGLPVYEYAFPLHRGWNLIGSTHLVSATYRTEPAGIMIGLPQSYVPGTGYVDATTIDGGKGYWVLASTNGTLIVPGARSEKAVVPDWFATTTFAGKTYRFGIGEISASRGVPPVSPRDDNSPKSGFLLDSYKMTDLFTPDASGWDFRAEESGVLIWDAASAPELIVTLNGRIYDVTVGGSIALAKGDVATFTLKTPTPKDYAVYIRPNPANAAFTVAVDLPDKSKLSIELFDMLGHKVATIADGEFSAGTQRFVWRAENQASGVYLVRVNWGEGSMVKRLVLLK